MVVAEIVYMKVTTKGHALTQDLALRPFSSSSFGLTSKTRARNPVDSDADDTPVSLWSRGFFMPGQIVYSKCIDVEIGEIPTVLELVESAMRVLI